MRYAGSFEHKPSAYKEGVWFTVSLSTHPHAVPNLEQDEKSRSHPYRSQARRWEGCFYKKCGGLPLPSPLSCRRTSALKKTEDRNTPCHLNDHGDPPATPNSDVDLTLTQSWNSKQQLRSSVNMLRIYGTSKALCTPPTTGNTSKGP